MGYQLKRVRLWAANVEVPGEVAIAVVVTPNCQIPEAANDAVSVRTCGGVTVHALQKLPESAVHVGAVPVIPPFPVTPTPPNAVSAAARPACELANVLLVLVTRSAGSCNSRIAFGLIGFVPAAGALPPLTVGAARPRANPSCSHSLVTGCQTPEASLYSTRNQPSIRFQVEVRLEFAVASPYDVAPPTRGK